MADTSTYPTTLDASGDLKSLVPTDATPTAFQDWAQLISDAVSNIQEALGTDLHRIQPVWLEDATPATISCTTSYQTLCSITLPSAAFDRYVVFWGQVSLIALSTGSAVYRAAIRTTAPTTVAHTNWHCDPAGLAGSLHVFTSPITVAAAATPQYNLTIRRDSGSGGDTDGDATQTKFVALVTPDL